MSDTTISADYAAHQRLRALQTFATHADAAVRERATARVARWQRVLEGMASGDIDVGDRAPLPGVPTWATLEVVTGGFATGRLLAEQPLDEHEQAELATLPPEPDATPRGRLNRHALAAGQAALLAHVERGTYRVELPEEAALAVVAWLQHHGHVDAALTIVEAIAPFIERLRFTPRAATTPLAVGTSMHRTTGTAVAAALRGREPNAAVVRMNEALRVWPALNDAAVALVLETVEGEPPRFARDASGQVLRDARGQPQVVGGQPFVHVDDAWRQRARALVSRIEAAQRVHHLRAKASLRYLEQMLDAHAGEATTHTNDVFFRQVLAGCVERREPGSEALARLRAEQTRVAAEPLHVALAQVLAARLANHTGGVADPDALRGVITPAEDPALAGRAIPAGLAEKLEACREAPIEELVSRGVVPSSEVLAVLVPQLSAQVLAAGIDDPALRRLYASTYGAFRRRRSLLLLDLQSQVKIDELPWVAALAPLRRLDVGQQAAAHETLAQLALLAVSAFPQTILPNPLVKELTALAKAAGLALPLVEEIAADIFQDAFTQKFQDAARTSATLLRDGLYARYYDLPLPEHFPAGPAEPPITKKTRHRPATATVFLATCHARAAEAQGPTDRPSYASFNGTVLEQAQILETHNLAVLFDALDLRRTLGPQLGELADVCFGWILDQLALKIVDRRAQLHRLKDCAYAWRQMIFFQSLVPLDQLPAFVSRCWGRFHERAQRHPAVMRFMPALVGLSAIAAGQRFDASGRVGDGRRYLGWSVGRHWLDA